MNLKDSRFEWICSGSESTGRKVLRCFAQIGCIIFGLATIFSMWYIPFFILAIICAVTWILLFRSRRTEYEFNYCSGDLIIFKISNGIRRRKKFACALDNINYIQKGPNGQTPNRKFYFNLPEIYTMQVSNSDGDYTLWLEVDERFIRLLEQEHKLRK